MIWPSAVSRHIFEQLDSTNCYARDNLHGAPFWVLAHTQTAGKGRRGRVWATQKGNFAATYCAPIDQPIGEVALQSFVAALSVYDACVSLGVDTGLSLKWPNDVLLNGGKLAGILLETAGTDNGQPSHLLVGIGINLIDMGEADMQTTLPPRSLKTDANLTISADDFLTILANTHQTRLAQFKQNGFAPIREAWLNHCGHKDQIITARTQTATHTGVFETLDADGALVLTDKTTQHIIHAGDIFFAPNAPNTRAAQKEQPCLSS